MDHEKIIVLDFGGQYNQLIARKSPGMQRVLRSAAVYAVSGGDQGKEPEGIIFTGGPNSVYDETSPRYANEIYEMGVPILGICYGAQLMAYQLGGKVETAPVSEYGRTEVDIDNKDGLFQDVADKTICWMSHTDYISEAPEGFEVTAHTPVCPEPHGK